MRYNRAYLVVIPILSLLFIVSVLVLGVSINNSLKVIEHETQALTFISKIRNDLTKYLLDPRYIDVINTQQWVLDFNQQAVQVSVSKQEWKNTSNFITQFNFNTTKREILSEINDINEIILHVRKSVLSHKNKLLYRLTTIVILGILACLFALLSSALLIINRKKDQRLKLKNIKLNEAMKAAEAATIAKSDFLNVMSHEIRTPLNGVIGLSNILAQSNPSSEQKKHIELLQFSTENLLALVNDILDFGKMEAGKVHLEERSFNLGNHLRKIISTLDPFARSKKLKLLLEIHNDFKNNVLGDPARIGQIVFNLVNNAIKFTPNGAVKVSLLLLNESEIDISVKITIKDTGIGISNEQRKQIFDKFSQANANTTRKYGGSGLGLSISQRLLEIMESGLFLESSPEKGSTFWFQLTLPKAVKSQEINFEEDFRELEIGKGKKILVVEDNKINLLIIERYLSELNLHFDSAENGKEAVELSTKNDYDLILMDLQMPEMDGYTASSKIKNLKGKTKPVILAISAANQIKNKKELNDFGIDDYIKKPIDLVQFKRKLSNYL